MPPEGVEEGVVPDEVCDDVAAGCAGVLPLELDDWPSLEVELLAKTPLTGVTAPVELGEFRYTSPPLSWATLTVFQPLLLIKG